jgi:hypothetical protein
VDETRYVGTTIVISGAGCEAVNGVYQFERMYDNVALFSRDTRWGHEMKRVSLYRCKMEASGYRWYISILHDPLRPGRNDTDFYYAVSDHDENYEQTEFFPPANGWLSCQDTYEPAPFLTIRMDAEYWSDPDDSAAVIDEDDHDMHDVSLHGLDRNSSDDYDYFGHTV